MASSSVSQSIESKLKQELNPVHLEVLNESHMHNVPANSETHFKVIVVSDVFATEFKTPIQRHRKVNGVLAEELQGPVHALSIIAKTPKQWQAMQDQGVQVAPSPSCRGGDGSLPPKNAF